LKEEDIKETKDRYRKRWIEFGDDPRTLGWNKGRQHVRFAAALEGLSMEDYASVLDVGCGFGDLLLYLKKEGWNGQYTGIDIVPELIAEARRKHDESQGASFCCIDILDHSIDTHAAMAVALGVCNHKLQSDNMDFISTMLEVMWNSASKVVVLDFLSTTADIRHENLFYADPQTIYGLARRFTRRVMIHHAYMPFEFQVKIWKDDSFLPTAPVFCRYKPLVNGGSIGA